MKNFEKIFPGFIAFILQIVASYLFEKFLDAGFVKIFIIILSIFIIAGLSVFYYIKLSNMEKKNKENEKSVEELNNKISCLESEREKTKEYLVNLESMGVVDGITNLKDTRFSPDKCMKEVKNRLDFMGIGGAKWVEQNSDRESFERMLNRVSTMGNGKIRFLLMDPETKNYKRLRKLRDNAVPEISYKILKDLVEENDCLEVRLYDMMPTFRLQFVDDSYVAVSRYYIEREKYNKYQHGWKNPHLVVSSEKKTSIKDETTLHEASLYGSFELLYNYIWDHSRDIKSLGNGFAYKSETTKES